MVGATDTLRQLGLWQEERPVHPTPERPQYTEEDLKREQQAGDGPLPAISSARRSAVSAARSPQRS